MAKYGLGLSISDGQTLTIAEGMALPITNGGTPTPVVRPTGLVSLSAGGSFQAPVPIYPPEFEPAAKTFLRPRHFQGSGFGSSYQPPTPMILTPIVPQWPDPVGTWLPDETYFGGATMMTVEAAEIVEGDFTLSAWVNGSFPWNKNQIFIGQTNSAYRYCRLMQHGTNFRCDFSIKVYEVDIVSSPVVNNQWVHLVGRKSGSTMTLWKNGVLANSVASGRTYPGLSTKWRLGGLLSEAAAEGDSPIDLYTGYMQHAMIWNLALSDAEISALYTAQLPTVTG